MRRAGFPYKERFVIGLVIVAGVLVWKIIQSVFKKSPYRVRKK